MKACETSGSGSGTDAVESKVLSIHERVQVQQ
jgi:hypothetical protein